MEIKVNQWLVTYCFPALKLSLYWLLGFLNPFIFMPRKIWQKESTFVLSKV